MTTDMTKNRMTNTVKLLTMVLMIGALYFPWKTKAGQAPAQTNGKIDIVGLGSSMDERVGKDDGAAFVIHFAGALHGNLDTCGWKGRLIGGLARRVSFINAFSAKFKDLPELLVDTGYFFSDRQAAHGFLVNYVVAQDEWVLNAYDQFRVDVANVSERDLRFFSHLLSDSNPQPAARWPVLNRMISANAEPEKSGNLSFKPFIVREIPNRPGAVARAKPVRVAFVGLCESAEAAAGFRILDPVQSALQAVKAARKEADVVVVLSHLKTQTALRVAREVPGIDVLIDGNDEIFTGPSTIGKTLVLFAPYEGRMLGEVRFHESENGTFSAKERFISLDFQMPGDPAASDFVAKATDNIKSRIDPVRKEAQGPAPPRSQGQNPSGYVTAVSCAKCHQAQHSEWVNSGHAHALTALAAKASEVDASCLVCHTTGFGRGGFTSVRESFGLLNVQCEQCHGPGRDHIARPDKSYGRIADSAQLCGSCHTKQTSPAFSLPEYLDKIRH
jgi:2',3'-cyclic-nucleotide 2'-phosphodiesterase (5'-nucleotidase family)